MKKLVLAAILATGVFVALPAQAKSARCVITSASGPVYSGPCIFTPEGKGGFTLTSVRPQGHLGETLVAVTVEVTGPGEAFVRGMEEGYPNSAWGDAKRSRQDPACWVGADFRICAY